jgi:hypothetical protein
MGKGEPENNSTRKGLLQCPEELSITGQSFTRRQATGNSHCVRNRQMRVKILNDKIFKAEGFSMPQKAATLSEADHLDCQGVVPTANTGTIEAFEPI